MTRNKYRRLTNPPNVRHRNEHASLLERFCCKFTIAENGCWVWTGSCNESGYGMIHVNEFKTDILAHRVSYMMTFGEIPDGMDVLHKCDNTKCVNPGHLFPGTNVDNVIDCASKGRSKLKGRNGCKNATSKLSESDVVAIRSCTREHGLIARLAKAYAVSRWTIANALNGKTYIA